VQGLVRELGHLAVLGRENVEAWQFADGLLRELCGGEQKVARVAEGAQISRIHGKMTPQEKSDSVMALHLAKFNSLLKRAHALRELPRNFDHRANELLKIVDELAGLVAPVASCKNCRIGHCCFQAVLISSWEAEQIAKFSKRKMTDAVRYNPEIGDSRDKLVDQFSGIPCTFLKDGQCSIYAVRPIMCRLHFSMDNDITNCDIIGKPNTIVPYFNFRPLEFAVAQLFLEGGGKFADIREFFQPS